MKQCSKCKKITNNFRKNNSSKDGLHWQCRDCEKEYRNKFNKSFDGIVNKIYFGQVINSKKRGHNPPEYTLSELKHWIKKQKHYNKLYNKWKNSGYKKELKPSVDRINNNKGYNFDNIRLVSWKENFRQSREDIKNGIIGKKLQPVTIINIRTGKKQIVKSMREAARILKRDFSGVCKTANGQQKTCAGYLIKKL